MGTLATGVLFGPGRADADPPAADWAGLAASLDGYVVLPSAAGYRSAKRVFNSCFDAATPAGVVAAKSVSDVQRAVAFAAAHDLKVAPRGGGHSYNGASTATGAMVLDLRALPGGVSFDDRLDRVTVTAATGLYAVHRALAPVGKAIPTGTCPTVGTAGLALGGGLGADSRHAGLTCDALVSASVVLPSGEAVTVTEDDHADLFWAIQGGGGGNFAVTTSMTFWTFTTGDTDLVRLSFPGAKASQVIVGWQDWLRSADRNCWALVDLSSDGTELDCAVLATCPAGSGAVISSAIVSAVGLAPVATVNRTFNHMELVMYLAGGTSTSEPRRFVAGSDVMAAIGPAEADAIVAGILAWHATAGAASVIVDAIDGAVGDVAPAGTAFPWRRHAAVLQWYVDTPSPEVEVAAARWLGTAHQAVQDHSSGGYVNYVEPNTTAARYFGDNVERLSQVRRRYDPARVMFSGLDL